jgi:nitroimidazol reductase NimA-like FMN-containing flavoprotein (pyridoxamine 5'-phosphate oxidase superfamily)
MLGELAPSAIESLLHTEWVARIGCHASRLTYVVPISYAYDGEAIYGHSTEGLKLEMLRANPRVCIEVDHVENLATWQSVIAWGRFEELTGESAMHAMQKIMARFSPMMTSAANTPTHGASPVNHGGGMKGAIYRIVLEEKSGRFERV